MIYVCIYVIGFPAFIPGDNFFLSRLHHARHLKHRCGTVIDETRVGIGMSRGRGRLVSECGLLLLSTPESLDVSSPECGGLTAASTASEGDEARARHLRLVRPQSRQRGAQRTRPTKT